MYTHVVRKAQHRDVLAPDLRVLFDIELQHGRQGAAEPLHFPVGLRVVRRSEFVGYAHLLLHPLEELAAKLRAIVGKEGPRQLILEHLIFQELHGQVERIHHL